MLYSNRILLGLFALMLSLSTVAYAESIEQTPAHEQLYAQVRQLETQVSVVNQKIAALEAQNKLEKQMSKSFFAQSSEKLHGRNR